MSRILFTILVFSLLGCTTSKNESEQTLQSGTEWLFNLDLGDKGGLPVQVEVKSAEHLVFKNAEEKIEVTDVRYENDSIFIKMPVFGSEFIGIIDGDTISGEWYNYNKTDYSIPFTAKKGSFNRFDLEKHSDNFDFSGQHQVTFFDDENNETKAVGVFKQNSDNTVTGTFLTETGDYRYLQGNSSGNHMKLSTFDGAHAFLFEATTNDEGILDGVFYSGTHWSENWKTSNETVEKLANPDQLTHLLPGYQTIEFEFPDENGKNLQFPNADYNGKVVILQIMGTWCPNCMDETRYFTELYDEYHKDGLEIIALNFEPKPTLAYFKPRAERFKKDLNVEYPIVLAGNSNKKEAVKSLPMLNHIYSYPTSIFIAKDGSIRKIHTGFSGPGTGQAYTDFIKKTNKLVNAMLAE